MKKTKILIPIYNDWQSVSELREISLEEHYALVEKCGGLFFCCAPANSLTAPARVLKKG